MRNANLSLSDKIVLTIRALAQFLVRLALVIACMVATFTLLASDVGLIQNHLLKLQIAEVQQEITKVGIQNTLLKRKLYSLRNDLEVVEFIARHDLRLVGKNEVLFDLPLTTTSSPNPTSNIATQVDR